MSEKGIMRAIVVIRQHITPAANKVRLVIAAFDLAHSATGAAVAAEIEV